MNDLRDRMHGAVDSYFADLPTLTERARRHGPRLRRRRRVTIATTALTTCAALTLAAATGSTLFKSDQQPIQAMDEGTASTISATGRSVAAGLYSELAEITPGAPTRASGTGPYTGSHGPIIDVTLNYVPGDGSGVGTVWMTMQLASAFTAEEGSTAGRLTCDDQDRAGCLAFSLPDGSQVRTYTSSGSSIAERLTPTLYVFAKASNGAASTGRQYRVTRKDPVFSADQLGQVISQPWWGFSLPSRLATVDVPTYQDGYVPNRMRPAA